MLKHAAESWGFSESEMDDFDPLINLLMESCALEFEKVASEIGNTQSRMLERLAKLLNPGLIEVQPAYGILQVRSAEPSTTLHTNDQFYYKPPAGDRTHSPLQPDFFFSPTRTQSIFDGAIAVMATNREINLTTEGNQRTQLVLAAKKNFQQHHAVWIGVELNEEIKSPDQLSFFFHWINQPESENWYQYLPYTEWKLDGATLQQFAGSAFNIEAAEKSGNLGLEFDSMKKIEAQVNELFSRHYITLVSPQSFEQQKLKPRNYPPEFEDFFGAKALQALKTPLWWIEIRFPTALPTEALDGLRCHINAVPVINRKLNKFTYKLLPSLNIVPLETDGEFLAIDEINNAQGKPVSLVPFAIPGELTSETYTLRYGMNRFDDRTLNNTLINLTELIKEESSYFSSLGEDFLVQHIRELNQILARIDARVKTQVKNESPYPYLAIKPGTEAGNVSIAFWSSNGAAANRISMGSKLISYRNSSVQTNSIMFLMPTQGGRNRYSDAEKIGQYKKSVLTHHRIVTTEDLKQYLTTELGSAAISIELNKTYRQSTVPDHGFVRCMEIRIKPASDMLTPDEWTQRLRLLQAKLGKLSVNNIPYQFQLTGNA